MTWHMIRLDLARSREFPQGSREHSYLLRAPLDGQQTVDLEGLHAAPEKAEVLRSRPDEAEMRGYLIHKRRGWVFSYGPGDTDDEPVFHLESHPLRIGEYVTVTEGDGTPLPYRVSLCEPRSLPA